MSRKRKPGVAPKRLNDRQLGIPRDLRGQAKAARDQGWTITVTGSKHLRWQAPDGATTVFCPRTPSDARSVPNVVAKLRRAGLAV